MASVLAQTVSNDPVAEPAVGPSSAFEAYLRSDVQRPLFIVGDSLRVLRQLPSNSIDCAMTSPPYWGHREYNGGGIGLEPTVDEYIHSLLRIFVEVKRVLKSTGSFWLNLGDSYNRKALQGVPWRVAIAMMDQQGWFLRNDVIWHKMKGPDNAKDKLRNVHEHVFHFVTQPTGYYYNVDGVRAKPRAVKVENGSITSGTGVSGVRYRRQIELSTALNEKERAAAFAALDDAIAAMTRGDLPDFRMVIRNQQRTTHSASEKVSGRAKELQQRGFYVLRYHALGSKPSGVWDIVPEDTGGRTDHYAAYPADLCRIPITATCPPEGVVLDPFCGTGTTNTVAFELGRKSVGVDVSEAYVQAALDRSSMLL